MPLYLNDVITRHQLYLEGVKASEAAAFAAVITQLDYQVSIQLRTIDQKQLNDLSKAALLAFIAILHKAQVKIYTVYAQRLLRFLKQFLAVDMDMLAQSLGLATGANIALPAGAVDRTWSTMINAPLPANGLYVPKFITTFTASAANSVEALVQQGYANGWTPDELYRNIRGSASNGYRDGQFSKINNQAAAVIATAMQFVSQTGQTTVTAVIFDEYDWVSILDAVTTEICWDRNGNRYQIGQGPIPPAHIRCRSHTVPVRRDRDEPPPPKSLLVWARSQPLEVLSDIFGAKTALAIQNGDIKAQEFKYNAIPLTISEFKAKQDYLTLSLADQ